MEQTDSENIFEDIRRYCSRLEKAQNILLVGTTGVGKSAFINTLIKAIVGEYIPRAKSGKGRAATKTVHLTRYEHCGVSLDDFGENSNLSEWRDIVPLLPNIYDIMGFDNEDTDELKVLFELIIDGYIPPGYNPEELGNLQREHGLGFLRNMFNTPEEENRMHKIVFVQSCRELAPHKLIECLVSAMNKCNCQSSPFVLITKCDLLLETENTASKQSQGINELEKDIADYFQIIGSLKHNRLRITNYSDESGFDNAETDKTVLEFLKRMVAPTDIYHQPPVTIRIPLKLQLKLWGRELMQQVDLKYVFMVIGAIFILLFKTIVDILFNMLKF